MARKDNDNFYRRQQEEANRIATAQSRTMNDIARLAKSQAEELRKLRRAFEEFAKAVLDIKTVQPFQGDVLVSATGLPLVPEGRDGNYTAEQRARAGVQAHAKDSGHPDGWRPLEEREGQPYPKVDITPDDKFKRAVVGGIVHQGIFSDIATADTEKRSLSQFAADADRRRRDGLASY